MSAPRELDERFADWVDGRLTPEGRAKLERELAQDPELARAAAEYRKLVALLRAEEPQGAPPKGFADAVLGALPEREPVFPAQRNFRLLPYLASGLAAASIATLLFLVGRMGPDSTRDAPRVESSAREAVPHSADKGAVFSEQDRRDELSHVPRERQKTEEPDQRQLDLDPIGVLRKVSPGKEDARPPAQDLERAAVAKADPDDARRQADLLRPPVGGAAVPEAKSVAPTAPSGRPGRGMPLTTPGVQAPQWEDGKKAGAPTQPGVSGQKGIGDSEQTKKAEAEPGDRSLLALDAKEPEEKRPAPETKLAEALRANVEGELVWTLTFSSNAPRPLAPSTGGGGGATGALKDSKDDEAKDTAEEKARPRGSVRGDRGTDAASAATRLTEIVASLRQKHATGPDLSIEEVSVEALARLPVQAPVQFRSNKSKAVDTPAADRSRTAQPSEHLLLIRGDAGRVRAVENDLTTLGLDFGADVVFSREPLPLRDSVAGFVTTVPAAPQPQLRPESRPLSSSETKSDLPARPERRAWLRVLVK